MNPKAIVGVFRKMNSIGDTSYPPANFRKTK